MKAENDLTVMRRAVALGKVTAFHEQAERLAELVQRGIADHGVVIDALWETAIANNLISTHGVEFVQLLLADAFGRPQPCPLWLARAA
jgi:hypothetical protein